MKTMFEKFLLSLVFIFSFSYVISQNWLFTHQQISSNSIYDGTFECQEPLSIGSFQNCSLTLSKSGKIIEDIDIYISGGMPVHNHGLPTSPKVTWSTELNKYLIEGLKFSMPGQWSLLFKIKADDDTLKDTIEMIVKVN